MVPQARSWHRWSGRPGAWCLDCGAEDVVETCLGGCGLAPEGPDGSPDVSRCPVHGVGNGSCLHPGEALADPECEPPALPGASEQPELPLPSAMTLEEMTAALSMGLDSEAELARGEEAPFPANQGVTSEGEPDQQR